MSVVLQTPEEIKPQIKNTITKKLTWRWEHLGLGAILLLSGFLGLWNLTINGYSNEFYAAPVRSMLQSWHNFFYLAFDPGGFITVDKPPLAFQIQTIFAYIFGYNGVSLLLPEALAGVGSVFILYIIVKRAFGAGAGLISALMLAVTPIFVVMNRHNNPDSLLLFFLMLSAWAILRAAESGKWSWLLSSGLLIGLAFNIKMLEAWIVLPAFYLMYFLFARTGWLKRILQLSALTAVIVVISFSWAVIVDLTPADQRPYIDGSTKNSVIDLIFGYNGLSRVDGNQNRGGGGGFNPGNNNGAPPSFGQPGNNDGRNIQAPNNNQDGGPGGGGGGFGGQAGLTRLITPQMGGEFNWFFPLAAIGLVYLLISNFFDKEKGLDRSRRLQNTALWAGWFLLFGIVFSFSKGTIHNYYLNVLAPGEAALAGITVATLWKQYRAGSWHSWLLPVALAASAFYQTYLLTDFTSWNWWLGPVLLVVGVTVLAGLILAHIFRNRPYGHHLFAGVTLVGTAALLVTPLLWSIKAVFTRIAGSIPSGLPTGSGGFGGGRGGFGGSNSTITIPQVWTNFVQSNLPGQLILVAILIALVFIALAYRAAFKKSRGFSLPLVSGVLLAFFLVSSTGFWLSAAEGKSTSSGGNNFNFGPGGNGSIQVNTSQLAYLEANKGDYKYLVAVSGSNEAAPLIIDTGQPVMSLGGFNGQSRTITSAGQVKQLVDNHIVRYFILGGGAGFGGGNSVVSQYVQQNCKAVNATSSGSNRGFGGQQGLYVCGG